MFNLSKDHKWNFNLQYSALLMKVLFLLGFLFVLSKYKPLIILGLFEILDWTKIVLKKTIPYIPLDLVFVFGLTASYFYSPWFGVIIFLLGVLNRVVLLSIELRHCTKCVRHFIFFFIVPFYSDVNFFTIAIIMLSLNYILKYTFNIARGKIGEFDKFHFHLTNFSGATILFYLIGVIFDYLPFLR